MNRMNEFKLIFVYDPWLNKIRFNIYRRQFVVRRFFFSFAYKLIAGDECVKLCFIPYFVFLNAPLHLNAVFIDISLGKKSEIKAKNVKEVGAVFYQST